VQRGYIGVEMAPVSPQLPNEATTEKGALVVKVRPGPAQKAGIKANDIVIEYDHKTVDTPNDLAKLVDKSKPGEKVEIKVKRGSQEKVFTLTVTEAPKPGGGSSNAPDGHGG
jgi:serine protease Do